MTTDRRFRRVHTEGASIRRAMRVLTLMCVLGTSGCTVCQVSLRDGNAANEIHVEKTVFGSKYIVAKSDEGRPSSSGLHDVVIKDNVFYDLVGVLTLGLFKPHDVSYRHVKPAVDDSGDMGRAEPDETGERANAYLSAQSDSED